MNATIPQLYQIIGELSVVRMMLEAQVLALQEQLKKASAETENGKVVDIHAANP